MPPILPTLHDPEQSRPALPASSPRLMTKQTQLPPSLAHDQTNPIPPFPGSGPNKPNSPTSGHRSEPNSPATSPTEFIPSKRVTPPGSRRIPGAPAGTSPGRRPWHSMSPNKPNSRAPGQRSEPNSEPDRMTQTVASEIVPPDRPGRTRGAPAAAEPSPNPHRKAGRPGGTRGALDALPGPGTRLPDSAPSPGPSSRQFAPESARLSRPPRMELLDAAMPIVKMNSRAHRTCTPDSHALHTRSLEWMDRAPTSALAMPRAIVPAPPRRCTGLRSLPIAPA
jgi:hypothetical protein